MQRKGPRSRVLPPSESLEGSRPGGGLRVGSALVVTAMLALSVASVFSPNSSGFSLPSCGPASAIGIGPRAPACRAASPSSCAGPVELDHAAHGTADGALDDQGPSTPGWTTAMTEGVAMTQTATSTATGDSTSATTSTSATNSSSPTLPVWGTVLVYVYTSKGAPVAGAIVTLSSSRTTQVFALYTGPDGGIQFYRLPLGATYTATAYFDGANVSAPIFLDSAVPGGTVVLELPAPLPMAFVYAVAGAAALVVAGGAFVFVRGRPRAKRAGQDDGEKVAAPGDG